MSQTIFVFGSNLAGRHGKGAALTARKLYGAEYGVAEGLTGNAYALPTCDARFQPLPREVIEPFVNRFIDVARARQDLLFKVTRVGCGLAYYEDHQIAHLFHRAPTNCFFDDKWQKYLGHGHPYWGTF